METLAARGLTNKQSHSVNGTCLRRRTPGMVDLARWLFDLLPQQSHDHSLHPHRRSKETRTTLSDRTTIIDSGYQPHRALCHASTIIWPGIVTKRVASAATNLTWNFPTCLPSLGKVVVAATRRISRAQVGLVIHQSHPNTILVKNGARR